MTDKLDLPGAFPGSIWFGKEEEEAVLRVVRNQSPFRFYGPKFSNEAGQFEREFGRFMASQPGQPWPEQSDFLVTAVNSGTGALEVAIEALGIGCGDEVAVQGFMWIATISAIIRNRAIPLLIDSDDTLNMDPDDLKNKVSDRTKLAIVVPMLGGCARIGMIMDVVREINKDRIERGVEPLQVLEDNAQSIGAWTRGQPGSLDAGMDGIHRIGSFGDIAVFSLQINKNITAGEGGVIVTRDPKLYQRVQAIHNVGFAANQAADGDWYGNVPISWGQGRRITELQAAIARVQLRKLDGILDHMRVSYKRFEEHLQTKPSIKLRGKADPADAGDACPYMIFQLTELVDLPDEERFAVGRIVRTALNGWGLLGLYLHDYEVHVYYNIPQLLNKVGINHGCPWRCDRNTFHETIEYQRGTLPRLDMLLSTSVGFHVPSLLTKDQEAAMIEVLDDVHSRLLE